MEEKTEFWVVFLASLLFSIGGIFFGAIFPNHIIDAGRGGAVGTALALRLFFVNRNYAARLFKVLTDNEITERIGEIRRAKEQLSTAPRYSTLAEVEKRVDLLLERIDEESKVRNVETRFVVAATFISTIAWGFGDLVAPILGKILKAL